MFNCHENNFGAATYNFLFSFLCWSKMFLMGFMRFTSLNQMSQWSVSLIRVSSSAWMLLYMRIIYRYYINIPSGWNSSQSGETDRSLYFKSERHNQFWSFLFEANSLKPKTVVAVAPSINVDSFACVLSFFKALFLSRIDTCLLKGHQETKNSVTRLCFQSFMTFKRTKDDGFYAFCFLSQLFSLEENCVVFCFYGGLIIISTLVLWKYWRAMVSLSCWRKLLLLLLTNVQDQAKKSPDQFVFSKIWCWDLCLYWYTF